MCRLDRVSAGGVVRGGYLYDHRSRLAVRSLASGTVDVIHDAFDRVIAEAAGGVVSREYLWLEAEPVGVLDAAAGGSGGPAGPVLYHVHADHLGRPEVMTDGSRAVVWRAWYEPFGAVHAVTGPASLDLRFPGQWYQLESGLAYNWHRHYDASLGRYTQPDPLGTPLATSAAGTPRGDVWPVSAIYIFLKGPGRRIGVGEQPDVQLAGPSMPEGMMQRDGANLFDYSRSTPLMRTDFTGLLVGSAGSRVAEESQIQFCSVSSDKSVYCQRTRTLCIRKCESIITGYGDNFGRHRRCIRECMHVAGCFDF